MWIQIPVAVLLVVGGLFSLIGAIGMVRFPDFYMRLHAPTKATTLGVGGIVFASFIFGFGNGDFAARELMIMAFLFVTAPVSANLIAKAGLHLRVQAKAEPPEELPHH
ncbi:Na+/H+ antiporter subunit G [Piscinibacter sakaiensis]|uniref:Na+/H+ antiporter subunit G n=1 Tax=Piscinibacter sakaiensis TaxID=1547922 RepID=UPI003AAE94CA